MYRFCRSLADVEGLGVHGKMEGTTPFFKCLQSGGSPGNKFHLLFQ